MNKQKGFTLVELLVVIAIIAILAGAVLLAINPIAMMQKSRDAKRLSDLDAIRSALNIALTEGEIQLNTAGPTTSAANNLAVNGTGYVSFTVPTGKSGLAKYMAALPSDPINSGDNVYTFQSVAQTESTTAGYELNCVLEHPDNLIKMTADGGNHTGRYEIGTDLTIIAGSAE